MTEQFDITQLGHILLKLRVLYHNFSKNSSNQGIDQVVLLKNAFYIVNSVNFKKFVKSLQVISAFISTKGLRPTLSLILSPSPRNLGNQKRKMKRKVYYNLPPPWHKNPNKDSVVGACNTINARDDKLLNLLRNKAAEKYTIIYTK